MSLEFVWKIYIFIYFARIKYKLFYSHVVVNINSTIFYLNFFFKFWSLTAMASNTKERRFVQAKKLECMLRGGGEWEDYISCI